MRLVHSISVTLLVSAAASLSACSEPAETPAGTGGTAGTGGSGVSGSAGTGGSGTSGTGGTGVADHPTDSSQTGIVAFLDAGSYAIAGMGFRPETAPSDGMMMPHLAVRRYFNETIIASKAAGNQPPGIQHTAGSMAIKEILEGTTVIGKAAMLRTDTAWIYYCMASVDGRCGTSTVANTATYAQTSGGACACHGSGTIVSHDAIP